MDVNEIKKIITSAHYKVLAIESFGSFVALTPDDRIIVVSVVTETEHIDEYIQGEISQLCATRDAFIKLICDTLEEVKVSISMAVVCNKDATIANKTDLLLYMNNVELVRFDGTKKSIYEHFPKIQVGKDDADNFMAFSAYIKTTISYIRQYPFDCLKDMSRDGSFTKMNENAKKVETQVFASPRELALEVKKYVKGQDYVVDSVAVPFFQHIESMRNRTTCDVKVSFLLAGNSGTGKSEIMRRFCQISGVPFISINTADCCPTAWKGPHISDHIGYYINDATDIELLRYAVLFFDEADKITHYGQKLVGNSSSDWDMDMQRELLRLYDKGYSLLIEKQSSIGIMEKYRLPVDNLLICFAGAFSGIDKLIDRRLNRHSQIGFTTPPQSKIDNTNIQELDIEDLEKWGYIPELLGRIGSFYVLNPMSEQLIYEIITTASESILEAHKKQCSQYNIKLGFEDDALRYIARKAMESKLGFRSVKTVLSHMMKPIYFNCDKYAGRKFIVDQHFIDSQCKN